MKIPVGALQQFDLRGKRVLVRFDGDVPEDEGGITDDFRLRSVLPTIEYCLKETAHVVLLAHRDRPGGQVVSGLSNMILGRYFTKALQQEVPLMTDIEKMSDRPVYILENLRFYAGEEKNSRVFATQLATHGDIYCNDAFAVSHRQHASVVALAKLLPHCAGFKVMEELVQLSPLINAAEAPYLVVLGGAKAADKSPSIVDLIDRIDYLLLGGLVAVTYLAAQGVNVGAHDVDKEQIKIAQQCIRNMHEVDVRLHLPVDFVNQNREVKPINQFAPDDFMLDIGPTTIELFGQIVHRANTIFWNGAIGRYEDAAFGKGTVEMARAIATSGADVRIGSGGDTIAAIHESHLESGFTFLSTGGGATLEYIAGKELAGIRVLVK